jgi:hypothetical protein
MAGLRRPEEEEAMVSGSLSFMNGIPHEPLAEIAERRDERLAEINLDHEASEDEPKFLITEPKRGGPTP